MKSGSKTRRAGQPSNLCTDPSVGGSCSSDNTDSFRRNDDVLVNLMNLLVVYLITQEVYK